MLVCGGLCPRRIAASSTEKEGTFRDLSRKWAPVQLRVEIPSLLQRNSSRTSTRPTPEPNEHQQANRPTLGLWLTKPLTSASSPGEDYYMQVHGKHLPSQHRPGGRLDLY